MHTENLINKHLNNILIMEKKFIDKCKLGFYYQKGRTFTDEDVIKILKRKGWEKVKEYVVCRLGVQWTKEDFWEACGEQILEKGEVTINNHYAFWFSHLQSDMSRKVTVIPIY